MHVACDPAEITVAVCPKAPLEPKKWAKDADVEVVDWPSGELPSP
jgi:hypothetical protein